MAACCLQVAASSCTAQCNHHGDCQPRIKRCDACARFLVPRCARSYRGCCPTKSTHAAIGAGLTREGPLPKELMKLWFFKDPAVDSDIRERFLPDIEAAGKGEYSELERSADGCARSTVSESGGHCVTAANHSLLPSPSCVLQVIDVGGAVGPIPA